LVDEERGSCKFEMDQTSLTLCGLWKDVNKKVILRNMKIIHQIIPLMKRRLHMNYGQKKDLNVIDPLSMGV
jgi:hypothetical protein